MYTIILLNKITKEKEQFESETLPNFVLYNGILCIDIHNVEEKNWGGFKFYYPSQTYEVSGILQDD